MLAALDQSIIIGVDLQDRFLSGIWRRDEILAKSRLLLSAAQLLGVPSIWTEQYPERMGGMAESLTEFINQKVNFSKRVFSCCGAEGFNEALAATQRKQVFLIGIETHICVNQTAHHLVNGGYDVNIVADAVSCRTSSAHEIGISRMREIGANITHTESVLYEWMQTADHPQFRAILDLVKNFAED